VAAYTNSSTGLLSRTTNVPDYNATYTLMGWYKAEFLTAHIPYILNIQNTAGTQWDAVILQNSMTRVDMDTNAGITTGPTLTFVDTWKHLALVRESSTSAKIYVDGSLQVTSTVSVGTSRTANLIVAGFSGTAGYQAQGALAAVKIWDRALTAAEVAQEMRTIRPGSLLSINSWFPMLPGRRTIDHIYARNLTEANYSDADGPPVSWGASPIYVNSPTDADTIVQEGYRWYADGTESGATALAAQDTSVTSPLGTNIILRALIDRVSP